MGIEKFNYKKTVIKIYDGSAGSWGALASTTTHLLKSQNPLKNIQTLLKTNQKTGFDSALFINFFH